MKQIILKVDTGKGEITAIDQPKKVNIFEYEHESTTLLFNFNTSVASEDRLFILFKSSDGRSSPRRLTRITANKFSIEIPREVLSIGRLNYVIQHYDSTVNKLVKYVPQTLLTVHKSLDITTETLESRPDVFAEMLYRIEQLEKQIKREE